MEDRLKDNFNLVIVGHVDHGKSTLIGRLLFDTESLAQSKIDEIKRVCEEAGQEFEFSYFIDHLTEERKQGITIDTSQIFFKTENRRYTIIDAPGHVEFMKNMVTGASQAEAAILIIDADEGLMEQTRRHSYVLSMLGLDQLIVVINKMDKIHYDESLFNELVQESKGFLDAMNLRPRFFIPISAYEGENVAAYSEKMPWYEGPNVLDALETFKGQEILTSRPSRYAVQDIYRNGKTIVAGVMESGIIRKGDMLQVLPGEKMVTVQSIEEFESEAPAQIEAGKSSGLVVDGELKRGDILCGEGTLPEVGDKLTTHIFWMDQEPLKIGERLIFKCSTQSSICEIVEIKQVLNSSSLELLDEKNLVANNQIADVILKTDNPIVTESFALSKELGRFVLERMNTCAGGIVTGV
jgi:sulfate adenylyltransferase large subunit